MDCTLTIIGIPNIPTIVEVNIRAQETVKSDKKFTAPVGMSGIKIVSVKPDKDGASVGGRTYMWFEIEFPGGATGWVRDDLVQLDGDCAQFGYQNGLSKANPADVKSSTPVASPAPAIPSSPAPAPAIPTTSEFHAPSTSTSTPAPTTSASSSVQFEAQGRVRVRSLPSLSGKHISWLSASDVVDCEKDSAKDADGYIWWKHKDGWSAEKSSDGRTVFLLPPIVVGGPVVPISSREGFDNLDRIKLAAYGVTGAFEGSGYAAYNNYDDGIVSYGLIQFTLAAGSLITVLQRYLASSQSDVANQLRGYMSRVEARDPSLRNDSGFRDLLIAAADEQAMKDAQHAVADEKYWDKVWKGYIEPRGLTSPLGIALLFDMGVNFGTSHGFVRLAEQQLGVPPQSKPGTNGITEEQLIQRIAELRKASHDKQAKEQGFYGLMKRGNFWMRLVNQGDWGLLGDGSGNVQVNTKFVQVKKP